MSTRQTAQAIGDESVVVPFPTEFESDDRLKRLCRVLATLRQHESWREQLAGALHRLIGHAAAGLESGRISRDDFVEMGELLLEVLQCPPTGEDAPHRRAELSHRAAVVSRRIDSRLSGRTS
jgi:hypothetical protein